MATLKLACSIMFALILTGCVNSGRYTMSNDQAPLRKPTTLEMVDQVPQHLPYYPRSLQPYVVFGKRYHPLQTAENYSAEGTASWYGRKFHGHFTANGERYDMYAMTAAHKTLPIPSFVRVTNLNNQKSIIVKVNDRGPFHHKRIIDLSYSAAYALDMLDTGTAQVKLESITVAPGMIYRSPQPSANPEPEPDSNIAPVPTEQQTLPDSAGTLPAVQATVDPQSTSQLFVQVVAASDGEKVLAAANYLSTLFNHPRQIPQENGIYKLRFGPLQNSQQAEELINALKDKGYPNAYKLYSAPTLKHN